jgi:Beta-fructosidases (levanase/invertase)
MVNNRLSLLYILLSLFVVNVYADSISLKSTKKYLNIPVYYSAQREVMTIEVDGVKERTFEIRLATDTPDYWVFCDISAFKNSTLRIEYPSSNSGLHQIYQADHIAGEDSLYHETDRPQFHFSSRRGWLNDPNGLVYYDGEYHLFYQHNPYEREWGNMHWGHAVSKDLIHWKELPVALYPDEHGTMFSGSAVIDYKNSAGFNRNGVPAMVAIYTADSSERQVQCIAYSLDKGRTWNKYEQNPVIDSKEVWNSKDTRDPKVFWYEPGDKWVMVLNERDGHSIYNSYNLKEWTYKSHITGFWECPELFELPVDEDPSNKKWVMYGASGTYMVGDFDGEVFTPEAGKYYYTTGSGYAAQTYNNIPASDGRRVQIGWGRIPSKNTPFNMLMLVPTEFSLRKTKEGVRLFSNPVEELDLLTHRSTQFENLTIDQANNSLKQFEHESLFRIKCKLELSHATSAGLDFKGESLLDYDMNFNTVNGVFYSPEDMTCMDISADIFIDNTSVEVFIDDGAYSFSFERKRPEQKKGFNFWGNNIKIKKLEVSVLNSIWE